MADRRLVIRVKDQMAELWTGDRLEKTYLVSTARNGLGCEEGSLRTPIGKLRVCKKIGAGEPMGTVFRGRIPTGEIWPFYSNDSKSLLTQGVQTQDDLILTRILWLEGMELQNQNTLQRFIYLHGTNQEHLIGQAASCGCIRFKNRDILELFELLSEGSEVCVQE